MRLRRKARSAWLPVTIPAGGAGPVRETYCPVAAPLGPFRVNDPRDGGALLSAAGRESDLGGNHNAYRRATADVAAQSGGGGAGQGKGSAGFIVWND